MMVRKKTAGIFILFIILTTIMTYPLLFNLKSHISGFSNTNEPYGTLWDMWWFRYAYRHNLNYFKCDFIAYPFGVDISKLIGGTYLWDAVKHFLSALTSEIVAYNLITLMGFLLSLVFMYRLTYFINRSSLSSLFSAIIFSFCPYHFARTWQHLALSQIQWMPLYILMLFKLKAEPKIKNMLFFALAYFLTVSFNFYYAYFMLISTFLFFLYSGLIEKSFKSLLRLSGKIIVAFVLVLVLLLPTFAQIYKNRNEFANAPYGHNLAQRSFKDLFSQSARPLSYFLPTTEHPLFGEITQNFIGSDLYGDSLTEHALYLGWSPLILAFFALRRWRQNKKSRLLNKENFYFGFFVFLAIGAWVFSQPAWWKIGSFKIYMPSFFMYKALPMFRAYCRFGILVMMAVAVLAAFGLRFILERFKSKKAKITITALFCSLVLFEFWNYPPFKVIDLGKTPAVYLWLKGQPKDIVIAEYPLDADSSNELYRFYQTKHAKRRINATIPGSYANKVTKTITRLSLPETAAALSWMKVKYVLVHKSDYIDSGLLEDVEESESIKKNKGLRFLKAFNDIDVYEVVAVAREPLIKD